LSRFDFALNHVPGTKIGRADGLSRRLNWKVGVERTMKTKYLLRTASYVVYIK